MNLDDYIKKEEEQRKTAIPNWATAFYDIDILNITDSKKELLKSFRKYINNYTPTRYADYRLPSYQQLDPDYFPRQIIQQIKTTDKNSMLILINTTYHDGADTCVITEEEYKKRIHKYQQIGAQSFYELNAYRIFQINNTFLAVDDSIKKYDHIFFSTDGKVFVSHKLARELIKISDDSLGSYLAQEAVDLKQKVYKK